MIPAHSTNYSRGRGQMISYIVVHYTANNGDTAAGNCSYFAQPGRRASAHYFVDEHGYEQSVADEDTAWHCGAQSYRHPYCRNGNSIGVELCSRKDGSGQYYFRPETVTQAAKLVRQLMEKYSVPVTRVLRHYDVTGKNCPAPFVEHPEQWDAFRESLTKKEEESDMTEADVRRIIAQVQAEEKLKNPDKWSQEAREWAEENGIITGATDGAKQYKAPCTREMMVQFLYRLAKMLEKA